MEMNDTMNIHKEYREELKSISDKSKKLGDVAQDLLDSIRVLDTRLNGANNVIKEESEAIEGYQLEKEVVKSRQVSQHLLTEFLESEVSHENKRLFKRLIKEAFHGLTKETVSAIEVQNREFKEENELNKILLEKKENRLEGLQKKLLVERITEKLWFKCLNNTLKILDSAIITCFMKFYKDDSIRMSFEEIGNVISEELSMLEERFVVVDFSRFILYRYLGDSIPELHFNFKDLREVYFHVDLLMIKITYIARGSMFQLTERDVFLICANFFDFEKWLTLLAPLIRKYISNEQLVLGLRDEEDFNKNDRSIEKEIPIGIPDSSLDDEVKLGIEDGNEEIPGMIRTHFERKRVEINKVLDDVSTEINELFTSSIVYNDRFGAMTHSDQEQMKSTQLSSQRKSVKKSIKKF